MSLSNLYPLISPSLSLDFAAVKKLDSRVTFTRTTTAVYYDGVQTAKAEENLLLQSQDFTTTWANVAATDTANTTVAPDGTTTADTILETALTNTHRMQQGVTLVVGQTYTVSVFAKQVLDREFQIAFNAGDVSGNPRANFDLTNGTLGTVDSGFTATITASTNGFYRCAVTFTAANSAATVFFSIITNSTAVRGESYAGDITKGVILWGAQLEQRSAVSSYTPTTTQPITNYIPVLQTAASGVARFDHNPTTGESLGLLVEEQRTNLLVQSEDFNTTWVKARVSVTTNTIVAPDGTLTGDKIFENTDNDTHFITGSTSFTTASASVTISVYAKKAERSIIRLQGGGAANWGTVPSAYFNLDTGVVSQTDAGTTASITPVGNGWYRCVITGTTAASGVTNPGANIYLVSTGTTISYAGNGYDGVFLWGSQFEAGAFPTSYIATTSASVTRNADFPAMTGTNFSSWYRADEGTYLVNFVNTNVVLASNDRYLFKTVNESAVGQRVSSRINTSTTSPIVGTIRSFFNNGSAFEYSVDSQVYSSGTNGLVSLAYKSLNDFAVSVNGNAAGTDTSGSVGNVNLTALYIGADNNNAAVLNGTIRKIAYYPSRLTNAQLQALTS